MFSTNGPPRLELAESFTKAVIDIVGVIDFHRRPGREQGHGVLVDHALRVVGIALRGMTGQQQYRRSMQPGSNERARGIGIPGPLRSGAKTDLAGETRIAVRHADGSSLMMRVNVFEAVFFTQLYDHILVGVAHDRENVIDAFSRNCDGQCLQYFHGGLHLIEWVLPDARCVLRPGFEARGWAYSGGQL
jgi:hypothetical protein